MPVFFQASFSVVWSFFWGQHATKNWEIDGGVQIIFSCLISLKKNENSDQTKVSVKKDVFFSDRP